MPTKLKSFELHGYKTFASRTEFEFADKVTAIIGPNGSGKSNVADALRWVLGEQSYSLLRGKKTEDMIFSGSETRSRAGMASATILFDNSDGWLPIDFSEVAITRRAYRDGQNEYLLNGQRVRLKDVSELLAQSGLAERTYTVIGQGLVDAALSLKADERRRLFEEAAGIGLYRSRKEEALRRLETTHRNIERVQDILAELQPRLRSLERQARRTGEFERIKADLHVYLLDWYGYHWHQAQGELAHVKSEVRTQDLLLGKARDAQQELDNQITGFRDRIQELRIKLAEKYNELSTHHSKKELITREIAVTNERLRSLSLGKQGAQSELSRHQEEATLIDQRLNDTQEELAQLKVELASAQIQFEECKNRLEADQDRITSIREQLELLKSEFTEILTRQANLDAHAARMIEQENQKNDALRKIDQAIDQLRIEKEELAAKNEKLRNIRAEASRTSKTNQDNVDVIKEKIKTTSSERDQLSKSISSYTAEYSRVRAELDVLEQAENSYQGYTEGTKLLYEAMRADQLSGGYGSLTRYITVPTHIETAIASVLGEYADAFLLDDTSGVDQALNILEQNAVRGILLPMAELIPSESIMELQNKIGHNPNEIIGIASELIAAPDNFRKAVDLLLGHVIIVNDRAAAKKILGSRNLWEVSDLRVVTLKGEVFHQQGPVITGSSGQTIISRPRRKKELTQELAVISGNLEERKNNLAKLEEVYSQLSENLTLAENNFTKSIALETQIAHELRQIETDLEKTERNLKWQIDQRENIEKENVKRGVELTDIQENLKVVEQSISDLKFKIQLEESHLQAIPIGEQQAQFTFWSSRIAVLERGLRDEQTRFDELMSSKKHSIETSDSIRARIDQIGSDFGNQEIALHNLVQEESDLNAAISELQQHAQPIESEVRSIENDLLNVQRYDVETRQTLSAAEHNYAQSRITFSQVQDKLERLRHRIEDDFGLVEYQYADEISGPTPLPLDGLVEKLPVLQELPIEIDEIILRLRSQLRRIGPINPEARIEFDQVSERINFLSDQLKDLQKADLDIKEVIAELDLLMEREFRRTFEKVAQEFRQIFTMLFGGGAAKLELTEPDDMNETGIEIMARLPGRREQGLSLLSGGERSLTASALIFALLRVSPPPFCVLDEVDAMLDEANVGRFSDMLKEMSQKTQFIVVTHNRGTIQVADVLYGVTMGRDSSSQVISLKMEDVTEEFGV